MAPRRGLLRRSRHGLPPAAAPGTSGCCSGSVPVAEDDSTRGCERLRAEGEQKIVALNERRYVPLIVAVIGCGRMACRWCAACSARATRSWPTTSARLARGRGPGGRDDRGVGRCGRGRGAHADHDAPRPAGRRGRRGRAARRAPAGRAVARDDLLLADVTARLAVAAAERGAELLDAPVSGGVAGAEAGRLTIRLGGRPPSSIVPARWSRSSAPRSSTSATGRATATRPRPSTTCSRRPTSRRCPRHWPWACARAWIRAAARLRQRRHRRLRRVAHQGRRPRADRALRVRLHDRAIRQGPPDRGRTRARPRGPGPRNDAARAVWVEQVARGAGAEDHTRMTDHIVCDAGIAPPWPHPDS